MVATRLRLERSSASAPLLWLGRSRTGLTVLAVTLGIAGCGGGGGGGPGSGPTGSSSSIGSGVPTPGSGITGVVPTQASAQIALLAGTDGGIGYRDGPALDALFSQLAGIAVDTAGNRFVVDAGNDVIRKIDSSGNVTTYAGTPGVAGDVDGAAAGAEFDTPAGIAVDAAGNLFVTEPSSNVVREITTTGQVVTLAGLAGQSGSANGTGSAARFNAPNAITIDSSDNLYVSDSKGLTIRMITLAGVVTTVFGTPGVTFGSTGNPADANDIQGMAFDGSGNLFLIDGNAFREISRSGVVSTIIPYIEPNGTPNTSVLCSGNALTWTGHGFVALSSCSLITLSTAGALSVIYSYAQGSFSLQSYLAVDATGNTYVTYNSPLAAEVDQFNSSGEKSVLAGDLPHYGDVDATGSAASFGTNSAGYSFSINGVASDAAGNLYVTDTGNNTIRKITPDGVVTTIAGHTQFNPYGAVTGGYADGQGKAASFDAPTGIVVNSAGMIYVADSGNQSIRQITPTGLVSTFAGTPSSSQQRADGTGPNALFSNPGPLAIDKAGNLYVGDNCQIELYGNNIETIGGATLRKITPAGVVTTFAGSSSTLGDVDGPVASALFEGFSAIAINPAGDLFVVDDSQIREITDGAVKTVFKPSSSSLAATSGLAIDAAGDFYLTTPSTNIISEIDASGHLTTYAGSSPAGLRPGPLPGGLDTPLALTVSGNGLAVTVMGGVVTIH